MALFKTQPHGAHEIILLEDAKNPMNRIYEIRQGERSIGILGSELISIIAWFEDDETNRTGQEE